MNHSELTVDIPGFDEEQYLSANPDARKSVEAGEFADGLRHYLRLGIEENRRPQLERHMTAVRGEVERACVSESGFFLVSGWLADEGRGPTRYRLAGREFSIDIPPDSVLRHARKDIEASVMEGPFDFGFVMFGKCPSRLLLQQPFLVRTHSETGSFEAAATPEIISDKRLLDMLLTLVPTIGSHGGKEANLYSFLASSAGGALVDLHRAYVAVNVSSHHARSFRPRPVSRSFVTVLFGSTDAMLTQPVLFRQADIDFGEWIYVCNSPEDAEATLRLGQMIADLYDVMITVIIMTDNVGFGVANNVAVARASSNSIYLINPDVFPSVAHSAVLRQTLRDRDLESKLWGGLLFYDDQNLMHSGMYIDWDSFFHCPSLNRPSGSAATHFDLARIEHFDKSVPFEEARWRAPKVVPAVSGALMAFDRTYFEKVGGFRTRYLYGHYEDADLSLRWAATNGPVVVDPGLRFIHLEGQGSRARGEQYRAAAMINRYLFSLDHRRSPTVTPDAVRTPGPRGIFVEG